MDNLTWIVGVEWKHADYFTTTYNHGCQTCF